MQELQLSATGSETSRFPCENSEHFLNKILDWADGFSHFAFCRSNGNDNDPYGKYDAIIAIDSKSSFVRNREEVLEELESFIGNGKWCFGYIGYDVRCEIENLPNENEDISDFPYAIFFEPRYLITLKGDTFQINRNTIEAAAIWDEILNSEPRSGSINNTKTFPLESLVNRDAYIQNVEKIRQHIIEGDVYELNYCYAFQGEGKLNITHTYRRLNDISRAPFSACFKADQFAMISSSPERFLARRQDKLISQPIKGTAAREEEAQADIQVGKELQANEKERAENIMIVDLVRNDLGRCCKPRTIEVEELCGLHTFKQVHQLVSTIVGEQLEDATFADIIRATFPMGSMTGAPKIMAMELIDRYENMSRGAYSGALGYVDPDGDLDFNVLIRSMFYNAETNKVTVPVGGAITYDSDPIREYEETLVKAKAMLKVLTENENI